jgi:DNA-binding CsgD family transcriptional regulator
MSGMYRLSARELRSVLKAIELLQADHSAQTLGPRIGAALRHAIPCDLISIDSYAPKGELLAHLWADPDWDVTFAKTIDCLIAYLDQHPLFESGKRDGLAVAKRISDVMSLASFRQLDIYNEFFRVIGLDRQMIVGISRAPFTIIALNRSGRDFSDSDQALLQTLKPYCLAAVQTSECVTELASQNDSLERAIEASGLGLVALSLTGQVRRITPSARLLLEDYFGSAALGANALPRDVADWLKDSLRRCGRSDLPEAVPAARLESNGCVLNVRLIQHTKAGHLLMLSRADRGSGELVCSAEEAASINLTTREAEVLRWVEQGMGSADIAVLCGLSVRTVHKHLEHVFEKLNVENRVAAVRKVRDLLASNG